METPASAPSVDATIAMFQPLIATTWLAPAIVKASTKVMIHAIAKPDQDAGGEPGLGLGHRSVGAVGRGPSKPLRGALECARSREELGHQRGADRPDLRQVLPVLVGRWRTDATRDLGGRRARRRETTAASPRSGLATSTSTSMVAGRVPALGFNRLDDADPWTIAAGRRHRGWRRASGDGHAKRYGGNTDGDRSEPPAGTQRTDRPARQGEEQKGRAKQKRDDVRCKSECEAGRRGPDGQPAARGIR